MIFILRIDRAPPPMPSSMNRHRAISGGILQGPPTQARSTSSGLPALDHRLLLDLPAAVFGDAVDGHELRTFWLALLPSESAACRQFALPELLGRQTITPTPERQSARGE